MEVKPGYKMTDVGVIPEDWEVKKFKDISEKIMVGIASAATHAYREDGIVLLRNQNIKDGYLDDNDILYISEEYEVLFKNKRLKAGDLLTARTGYPGTTCIVPKKYEGAQSFTTLITRLKQQELQSDFICYYINSEKGQFFFESNQIGGGQKNVNAGSLKTMPIPIPPNKEEQHAIATALSDADALIHSLERLIAKKRDIRQGAMQELLTGKKRLPGFEKKKGYKQTEVGMIPEDWEVKCLGEVSFIKTGSRNNENKVEDGIYPFYVRSPNVEKINTYAYDCEAILVPGEGNIGNIFHYINGRFDVHQRVYAITRFSNEISGKFIFYYMSKYFGHHALTYTVKATVDSLRLPTFQGFDIATPPTLSEQTAIAAILSDMDAEIAALESKLTKARQIKQGMMQELLTGRIRLT